MSQVPQVPATADFEEMLKQAERNTTRWMDSERAQEPCTARAMSEERSELSRTGLERSSHLNWREPEPEPEHEPEPETRCVRGESEMENGQIDTESRPRTSQPSSHSGTSNEQESSNTSPERIRSVERVVIPKRRGGRPSAIPASFADTQRYTNSQSGQQRQHPIQYSNVSYSNGGTYSRHSGSTSRSISSPLPYVDRSTEDVDPETPQSQRSSSALFR